MVNPIIFFCLFLTAIANNEFETGTIQYSKALSDKYPDKMLWILQNDRDELLYVGSPNNVTLITEDYFDNFIIDRWSNTWLAGNVTWVIAVTTNFTKQVHYSWGLHARSIHILNDNYFQNNDTIRFGLIDSHKDEFLKETLGGRAPCTYLIKDGIVYRNKPF